MWWFELQPTALKKSTVYSTLPQHQRNQRKLPCLCIGNSNPNTNGMNGPLHSPLILHSLVNDTIQGLFTPCAVTCISLYMIRAGLCKGTDKTTVFYVPGSHHSTDTWCRKVQNVCIFQQETWTHLKCTWKQCKYTVSKVMWWHIKWRNTLTNACQCISLHTFFFMSI